MEKRVKIKFRNEPAKEFQTGISLVDLAKNYQHNFNFPIIAAKVNNEIKNLSKEIDKKCNIDFYDRSCIVGNEIYASGLRFLLIVAINKLLGQNTNITIENSVSSGVYCEIDKPITEDIIKTIEKKMKEMVKEDYDFVSLSVSRIDAIHFFKSKKQDDKVNLLKYISNSLITLYRLDDVYDYFFSELPTSTKYLDDFKLTYISEKGFVLTYPTIHNPATTANYKKHDKLFDNFLKYTEMCRKIGISNISDLNEIVGTGKYNNIIQLSEAYYNSQLKDIADKIEDKKNIKIILLAGPSSSGKTTTTMKLAIYLQAKGYKTHSISIDDYFYNRTDTPLKANGEKDFESLRAVDTDLFNKHLLKLLDGEKVLLPEYNFMIGEREYKKKYLQLKEKDIILVEGLHALNEELTLAIEPKNKFKVYISPLTQLNIDNHNHIHTTDTRKLRRIIRDNKYRNYTATETLNNWINISEGEQQYVFPYQNQCDVIFNSALLYEIGVLKTYAEPLLFSVDENDEMYPEAIRLINLLRNFLPIPSDEVPRESVLREFIGRSVYREEE